jgi:tetratricopeptide (TPR) repeat protein
MRPLATNRRAAACLAAAILAGLCGCAGMRNPATAMFEDSVGRQREERRRQTVERFEQKRDEAEFVAAVAEYTQGDDKGCEETLRRLLGRNANHLRGRLLLTELYLTQGRLAEARQQAETALGQAPDDAQAHYTLALVLEAAGHVQPALDHYDRAAELEPENELYAVGRQLAWEAARRADGPSAGNPGAEDAVVEPAGIAEVGAEDGPPMVARGAAGQWLQRGRAALARGACEEALAYFREAAAQHPDDPNVPVEAAVLALRSDQPDLAVEILQPAESRFPHVASVKRALAAAHYRLGDDRSSEVLLRQALSLDNTDALAYFLMGRTLARLGQTEAAESHFRQARSLDPRYGVPQ